MKMPSQQCGVMATLKFLALAFEVRVFTLLLNIIGMIAKEYFVSLGALVDWSNQQGINKNDIIDIIKADGMTGYYLLYQEKEKEKEDNG